MKIKIVYSIEDMAPHYWATTTVNKTKIGACGTSFEDAKDRLLKKLLPLGEKKWKIPDDEEVDI